MEGPTGKELRGPRERRAGLSSSLQKLRPWVLGKKEGMRQTGPKGIGEVGNTSAKDPQDRAGQDPGEQRGGKEKKPKMDYLLDFLRTPELEGRERGKKREKIKAHINLMSQKLHFLTKRSLQRA